ncbi:hypothetical protein BDY24DRAFT_136402 [Mrakia frigida]|uniref:uncharacterized protein n=1 Tax=Mrakia frigida TaxID=29902 RepID=UPI003FCC2653
MLPFPAGSYTQPHPRQYPPSSFPGPSHIPGPAVFSNAAPPPPPMDLSSTTPSSSEAGPSSQGKKRSRAPSTSQKGEGDYGSGDGEEKKKKKGKEKAAKSVKEDEKEEGGKNRTGKACLNCRRQKMKCEGGDNPPCARCKASNSDCIFKPRANAAILIDDAQWQEMVERRLGSLESEMRAANHRPSSPTRSSSGMSIVRPPSSSSNRQLSQSFPDSQQPLPYNSYSQPTPKQSEIKSEHRLGNSPPRSPPFFSTPQTSNSMPPPSLPPPQIGSPQMTERFRSMADTLGLTLEQLQETRTSIFDGGREVDMTALTFEGVMTCWEL